MPETEPRCLQVPSFGSDGELYEAMNAKANFQNKDLYFRDGSQKLGEIEERLDILTRAGQGNTLAYNSGMSATTAAIDAGLSAAESDRSRPLLACAHESYSQTKRYIDFFLRGKRADVVYFDSGDADDVERILGKQPDVLVSETVGNYLSVPVLDVERLLETTRAADKAPVLVLDNTLPLSTGMPIAEKITDEDNVIVVESGTKSYSFNEELLGVSYTKNPALKEWLKRYRRTRGDLPGNYSQAYLVDRIPRNLEDFDERNKAIFKTTGDIAVAMFMADEELLANGFQVSHPSLPTHSNHQLYTEQYGQQGAPVIYVNSVRITQYAMIEQLFNDPQIEELANRGQSFGFDEARIIYDELQPAIRIAGGVDTDGTQLGAACKNALLDPNFLKFNN